MVDSRALADELEELVMQLAGLDSLVSDEEGIGQVAEEALSYYENLGMIGAMFEAPGIEGFAGWVLGVLREHLGSKPRGIVELLRDGHLFAWIEMAALALRESGSQAVLDAVTDALSAVPWPAPPDSEGIQRLLSDLRGGAEPEDAEPDPTTQPEAVPVDELHWDNDVHPELLEAYLRETPGQVSQAAKLIREIASGRVVDDDVRKASRLVHTVKGASGVVGVRPLVTFSHRLEDLLDHGAGDHMEDGLSRTLVAAADCLESLYDNLVDGRPLPAEFDTLLADIEEWDRRLAKLKPAKAELLAATPAAETESPEIPANLPDFIRPKPAPGRPEPVAEPVREEPLPVGSSHLAVSMGTVQDLLNLAGELITSTSQIAEHSQRSIALEKQLRRQDEHVRHMLDELNVAIDQQTYRQNRPMAQRGTNKDGQLDELELDAYNELHSNFGLLAESIADSRELTRNLQVQMRQIADQIYEQQRLQRRLSETVLGTRLVPVRGLLARIERTVRETCRATGKDAEVQIVKGRDLSVDTDILNGLTAPLLHLLRNAVDHGIEAPQERARLGKPAQGRIELAFEQRGDQIHLTLSDDGQGMDLALIHEHAVASGMVEPDQDLSSDEILRLILEPGFTTRNEISEISGRGVGLDVVRVGVEELQGLLYLENRPGQGMSFHLQVPQTLIATHAVVVRVAGNLVAIPGASMEKLYVGPEEYVLEGDKWSVVYMGQSLEVLSLATLLGWRSRAPDLTKGHTLVVVENERKRYALHVDEVLKPRDIVVKSLAPWLNIVQGVSGACVLADGAVAPVLDMLRLLRHFEHAESGVKVRPLLPEEERAPRPRILIVDDSLTIREAMSGMVEQMGYEPISAVDGLDALQRLNVQDVELVLTDLEMPRMNGLEMAQAIRVWPERRHLPIVMITSRSTRKHKDLAEKAGVDDYLTKPVDHGTLGEHIRKWLRVRIAA